MSGDNWRVGNVLDLLRSIVCRYNVILTIFTYFVPITAMGLSYFQVGVELWGSQGIGECTDHQMENIRSKRRVSIVSNVITELRHIC